MSPGLEGNRTSVSRLDLRIITSAPCGIEWQIGFERALLGVGPRVPRDVCGKTLRRKGLHGAPMWHSCDEWKSHRQNRSSRHVPVEHVPTAGRCAGRCSHTGLEHRSFRRWALPDELAFVNPLVALVTACDSCCPPDARGLDPGQPRSRPFPCVAPRSCATVGTYVHSSGEQTRIHAIIRVPPYGETTQTGHGGITREATQTADPLHPSGLAVPALF